MNIIVSEFADVLIRLHKTSIKLKRETMSLDELKVIADPLDIEFEQVFILPDGNEIKTGNE